MSTTARARIARKAKRTKKASASKLAPHCPMDVVFRHLVSDILALVNSRSFSGRIDRQTHRRVSAWLAKLSEPMKLTAWKRNRNLYAGVLLGMLKKGGRLGRPFDVAPTDGALPTMPNWMKIHAAESLSSKMEGVRRGKRFVEDDTAGCTPCNAEYDVIPVPAQCVCGQAPSEDVHANGLKKSRTLSLLKPHRIERERHKELMDVETMRGELQQERFRRQELEERIEDMERQMSESETVGMQRAQRVRELATYANEWQQRVDRLVARLHIDDHTV